MKFIWSLLAGKPFIKEQLCQHFTCSKQLPTLINSQPNCCPLTALAISSHRRSDSAQLGMQRQRYVGENWEDRLCTLRTIIWGKSMQKYMFWCCSNAAGNHQNHVLLMSLQLCSEVFYVDSGTNNRLEYYVSLFLRVYHIVLLFCFSHTRLIRSILLYTLTCLSVSIVTKDSERSIYLISTALTALRNLRNEVLYIPSQSQSQNPNEMCLLMWVLFQYLKSILFIIIFLKRFLTKHMICCLMSINYSRYSQLIPYCAKKIQGIEIGSLTKNQKVQLKDWNIASELLFMNSIYKLSLRSLWSANNK